VSGIGIRQRCVWRRLVSCVAAYAFALQMVLFAFAAPAISGLAPDQDALSAALCSHDKSAPPAPAQHSNDDHCKFCPAGGHHVFTAPTAAHHTIVRTAEAAAPAPDAAFAPPTRGNAAAQPRGPPQAA
jgi:Protein of unknown function (DUF2946)